jgi:F0F1-type ATP synthase membrane subunit c/vacuolar-type H+-ATPase subunit K
VTQHDEGQSVGELQPTNQTVLWILWAALTGSLGIYALVGLLVQSALAPPLAPELLSVLTPLFGVVGLLFSFVMTSAKPLLAKLTQYQYQPYSIIRWALAEAVGISGLVLFFLGASWTIFGGFLTWALLLQLRLMPTADAQAQFERLKRQAWMSRTPQSPSPLGS